MKTNSALRLSFSVLDGNAANIGTKVALSTLVVAGAVGVCLGAEGAGCEMAVDMAPEAIGAVSQFLPDAAGPTVSWKEVKDLGAFADAKTKVNKR